MSQPIQEPTIGLGEDIEAFGYKQELRRGLQLHDVVLYGVLFMVLIAPQSIWGSLQVDSGGLTPLVYIIGFVAISFTALSYAAMSSKFPIAGSVYSYVQRAINRTWASCPVGSSCWTTSWCPRFCWSWSPTWGNHPRARLSLVALGGRVHRFQHVCERARHHHVERR